MPLFGSQTISMRVDIQRSLNSSVLENGNEPSAVSVKPVAIHKFAMTLNRVGILQSIQSKRFKRINRIREFLVPQERGIPLLHVELFLLPFLAL